MPDFSDDIKDRMAFGTKDEIDAITALVGTVLPFLYPNISYYEKDFSRINNDMDEHFMVVRPDGSLRTSESTFPDMMYENKCKSPHIPSTLILRCTNSMRL